jgi:hypothetical protein
MLMKIPGLAQPKGGAGILIGIRKRTLGSARIDTLQLRDGARWLQHVSWKGAHHGSRRPIDPPAPRWPHAWLGDEPPRARPAIFGELLGSVVLRPSALGALIPKIRHVIFPDTPAVKDILLLLLVAGLETNLALVKRGRGTAILTSLMGIAVPFCLRCRRTPWRKP